MVAEQAMAKRARTEGRGKGRGRGRGEGVGGKEEEEVGEEKKAWQLIPAPYLVLLLCLMYPKVLFSSPPFH